MSDIPVFKPITLADKPLFDRFFSEYRTDISEFTFTNLFSWRGSQDYLFSIEDSHLLIHPDSRDGKRVFYQPIGPEPEKIIPRLLSVFPDHSIEKVSLDVKSRLSDGFTITSDAGASDYVYGVADLIGLNGSKYESKRNFIKRFSKYNPKTRRLDSGLARECISLVDMWCRDKGCDKSIELSAEDKAVKEALSHFAELNLHGIALLIDGMVCGFAIGEPLNNDTFVEHFEKADTRYTGIYQALLNEFAKSIPAGFQYLNREQDMGVEGLRTAKQSYHPARMIEKYSVRI